MNDFWSDKRVLVTGATGLVGTWLTKRLVQSGAYVATFIRDADPQSELLRSEIVRQTSVVNGRLEDFRSIERAINEHEIDTVFHLGAQTIVGVANRSPIPTFEANIRGTYNLLEACRVHTGLVERILIASSDKAYGDCDILPYTEDTPPLGRHPYDVSKSCTDLISQAYYHTYELPLVIARCGNIYGGGDLNWSRIVPGTIRSYLRREPPIIRSDGTFRRDYLFVDDAVEAYLRMAIQSPEPRVRGEAFNFGPGEPLSVLDIVSTIGRLMGCSDVKPKVLNEAHGEIRDQFLDSTKAREILGWTPQFDLETGLERTIHWYRAYLQCENHPETQTAGPAIK